MLSDVLVVESTNGLAYRPDEYLKFFVFLGREISGWANLAAFRCGLLVPGLFHRLNLTQFRDEAGVISHTAATSEAAG